MKPGGRRWLIRLAVVLAAALGVLVWGLVPRNRNLTIENGYEQSIRVLTITLAGQKYTYNDVPAGGEVTVPSSGGEDNFRIQAELADGTLVSAVGRPSQSRKFRLQPGGLEPRRQPFGIINLLKGE
jgi:hypothetical protein